MSRPLTEEQREAVEKQDLQHFEVDNPFGAILRRLDFLERKVQAANRLADAVRSIAPLVTVDYDEVAE